MTFWPSTLPPDPLFDAITARVLAAAADRTDKEWKGRGMIDVIERLQRAETTPLAGAESWVELWQVLGDARAELKSQRLAPDEREAINAMACYFDTKGSIQMQAWGSLLRVILLRNDRLGQ